MFDGPYSERLALAFDGARTDFERDAIRDGSISRAEYKMALRLFVDCMSSNSVEVRLVEGGDYYSYELLDEQASLYEHYRPECKVGTVEFVEPLFVDMRMNPENLSIEQNVLNCLVQRSDRFSQVELSDVYEFLSQGTESVIQASDPVVAGCLASPAARDD